MIFLPTMRRKILSSFLLIVVVFGVMGVLMIAALSITSNTGPALLHINYDSIEAADKMKEGWNALRFPNDFPELPPRAATEQFDRALIFEEGNITELGEIQIAKGIRKLWDRAKFAPHMVSNADFRAMHGYLRALVDVNEIGMFARVAKAKEVSSFILVCNGLALCLTLFFAVYLSDSLATRLALPLKAIAEALRAKPSLEHHLKLPAPTSIELRILIRELRRLWDSLVAANKVNIAELVQQKVKLETLLDSVEDAFLVLGSEQGVTHCNHLAARLIGLPVTEIVGHPWNDLSTANDNYLLLRDVLEQAGDQETEAEMVIDRKKYNFVIRCRRIKGRADEILGRIVLLRDITEKRQRERLRAELVDLLSHELKTPVQSLGMAAEMLAKHKDELSDRLRFFIDTINEDVSRIRAVAQQFIQASQAHTRSLLLALTRTAINESVQEWLKPFQVIAEGRNVTLRYEVHGDGPLWVEVDTIKFPWVVSNLLSNAIRVSPAGSQVDVTITGAADCVKIAVADQGPGIPEPVQRRMYEAFFQGPVLQEGGHERGMLGVGLTIAKEVVEAHEGRLEYAPREPHGSVFTIVLPTAAPMQS